MSTTQNTPEPRGKDPGVHFPVEAKIAVGVIAIGVVGLILKAAGVL